MPTRGFDFKHFHVAHDRCAMKVGTDGVLLGAWADVVSARRVLDVGCGSGLIALMVAQRSRAQVVGVEVDDMAAGQAAENVAASPWAGRIEVVCSDIAAYVPPALFDHVVSNPPFHEETTLPPAAGRAVARHTSCLSFAQLLAEVERLLAPGGRFHTIVPASAYADLVRHAAAHHLFPYRQTDVVTRRGKPTRRVLASFAGAVADSPVHDELVLCEADGSRTEAYARLTADFYLDIPPGHHAAASHPD